ncbi:MAG: hypothetical protein AAGE92_15395 [Cyanobacteria bacterium P01_G01_bin.4]
MTTAFGQWVEIEFDCLPLRTVSRFDLPDDASPKLAAKLLRIRQAVDEHGTHNTYFLHNASCTYRLTNDPQNGTICFHFDGTVMTDTTDLQAKGCDLKVELGEETCAWLNQGIVDWLAESVQHSVLVEFNRYIQAGDLKKTVERIQEMEKASDDAGGFVGMYL